MDAIKAIHTRQSISKVKPDPLPREIVEELLAAAVQAPNHYRVRPWRFFILTGPSRERLGEVMARSLIQQKPDLPEAALEKERSKATRAPVLIAIAVDKPTEPRVDQIENICAAAAASQNLLLAAHALGLAAKWRTGSAATDPEVKKFFDLEPDQHLIAFLYIGYPEFEPAPVERPGYEDHTIWMDDVN